MPYHTNTPKLFSSTKAKRTVLQREKYEQNITIFKLFLSKYPRKLP